MGQHEKKTEKTLVYKKMAEAMLIFFFIFIVLFM